MNEADEARRVAQREELEVMAIRMIRFSPVNSREYRTAKSQLERLGWTETGIKAARGDAL